MRALFAALVAVCAWVGQVSAATLVGRWDFEDTLEPTVGTGSLTPADPPQYEHISINGVEGHSVSWVQGTPAGGDEQYFTVPNPIGGNGGGAFTNQYTVVMDVKFDGPGPTGGFTSLAQTAAEPNGNDADWFLRGDGGMGISGDYTDASNDVRFPYGEFVRVAWVVDTTTPAGGDGTVSRTYLNGQLQNVVQSPSGWGVDGRYSLGDVFHVFADEDGETNAGEISTLMLFDGALSPQEVAALGGPQATVPEPSAACFIAAAAALALRRRRGRASRRGS
jgi:hypothetical protein